MLSGSLRERLALQKEEGAEGMLGWRRGWGGEVVPDNFWVGRTM